MMWKRLRLRDVLRLNCGDIILLII